MANGTVNKVVLIGNVGRDPEIKHLDSGMVIGNFSLATSETRKNKEPITEWHRIVVFNKVAEIVEKWVKKGSKLYLEGKIQTKKWTDKDGIDKYTTEIVCDQLQMLGDKSSEPAGESTQTTKPIQVEADFIDSDIPF